MHALSGDPEKVAELEKVLQWQQKRNWKEMNPDDTAGAGTTPAIVAALEGNSMAIRVLHQYGAHLAKKDANGKTAYDHAVLAEKYETAALIDTLIKTKARESKDEESLS